MKESQKSALPGFPWKGNFTTKGEIDQYFSNPDGIQCLLCGRMYEGLNGHLQIVHGVSFEKYRDRYGLPWRKGLVSRNVSKGLSSLLTKRIKNGTFIPKPNNKAAVAKIRAGGIRKDQPYLKRIKAEKDSSGNIKPVRFYLPEAEGRELLEDL